MIATRAYLQQPPAAYLCGPWSKLISNEAKQSKHHACIVNNTPTIVAMVTMAEATMEMATEPMP